MGDKQILALGIVVVGGTGFYLHSQKKLTLLADEIRRPSDGVNSFPTFGKLVVAFLVLLFIMAVLPSQYSGWVVGLILLGALVFDVSNNGNSSVINQLFGTSQ